MLSTIGEIVLAYLVADLVGSLYHYATDNGWNTKRIVAQFMKHHDEPKTITFDLEPMLGGLPILAAGYYFGSTFLLSLGVFIGLIQIPHYYVHHPAPKFVKVLQAWGVFLSPESHEDHHKKLDRSFSVLNGWTNPFVNWLLGKQ